MCYEKRETKPCKLIICINPRCSQILDTLIPFYRFYFYYMWASSHISSKIHYLRLVIWLFIWHWKGFHKLLERNELIHIFGLAACLCNCLWVGTGQLFFSIVGVPTKTAVAPASDHRSPNSKQSRDWAQIVVLVSATAHFLAIWHGLHNFEVCKDLLECLSSSVTPFVFAKKLPSTVKY